MIEFQNILPEGLSVRQMNEDFAKFDFYDPHGDVATFYINSSGVFANTDPDGSEQADDILIPLTVMKFLTGVAERFAVQ